MRAGLKLHQGHSVGRDPREMTPEDLTAAGHEPMSPLQAIRAHCLDCCAGQPNEVAVCTAVKCPSWPFRMATDPWRKPASEARREAARRTMTNLNARRRKENGARSSAGPPDHVIAPSPASEPTPAPTWATGAVDQTQYTVMHRANGPSGQTDGEECQELTDFPMEVA
jgi:hypothetical protein